MKSLTLMTYILTAASAVTALPTCKLKRRLATRDTSSADYDRLPFTSASSTSEHRTSSTHPNDWTTVEVTSFLDRIAANLTARQGGGSEYDTVPEASFIYSEPTTTKTKFALFSPSDVVPHPRALMWKDVSIGMDVIKNQTLAAAKTRPDANHSMLYFAYFVGNEQYLARGFFGDSTEVLPGEVGPRPETS